MKLASAIKPISYVKAHAAEVIREVSETNGVVIITQNGEGRAVIQSLVEYERQQESLAMLKLAHQSRKSFEAGHKREASEVFDKVRRKLSAKA